MKLFANVVLAALVTISSAGAVCPYTTVFTQYGLGCGPLALATPTLSGGIEPSAGCGVRVVFSTSLCCGSMVSQWLFLGGQQLNIPLPEGCTLLAAPDFLAPLPPVIGPTKMIADLPQNPALVGSSIYLQGVVERAWNGGTSLQFTNGLELRFDP